MQSSELFEMLSSVSKSNLRVNKTRCINVRNRNTTCRKCMQACPSGCLSLFEEGAELKPEACTACGICTTVCPTGALELKSPSAKELREQAKGLLQKPQQAIEIKCDLCDEPMDSSALPILQVPCFGALDESLLTFIAGEGVEKIYINISPCENCNFTSSKFTVKEVCENANAIFEAWGSTTRVHAIMDNSQDSSNTATHVVRRAKFIEEEADESDTPKPTKRFRVGKDGTLPHVIPEKRETLLEELRSWIEPTGELLESSIFGVAIIDKDTCTSCRMCTVFCPTGALSKPKGKEYGVQHRADICLGCKCCQDICPTHSITISNVVPVSRIVKGNAFFHEMKPLENVPGNPHQTLKAIKKMLGEKQIYER